MCLADVKVDLGRDTGRHVLLHLEDNTFCIRLGFGGEREKILLSISREGTEEKLLANARITDVASVLSTPEGVDRQGKHLQSFVVEELHASRRDDELALLLFG